MRKGLSGSILVSGPIIAIVGAGIAQSSVSHNPADDFYFDCWRYAGGGMILAGLAAFFLGCMWFARSK